MNIPRTLIAGLLAVASVTAWAQQPGPGAPEGPGGPGPQRRGGPPGGDRVAEHLFPPELIRQHQELLDLTADQQTAMRAEMQKAAAQFADLQWQLSTEESALASLLKPERPDEKQVLAQLDKLLSIESQMKRLHLGTMIRIKKACEFI